MKLNITELNAIMNTINDIAFFLNVKAQIHEFTVLANATTRTIYKLDGCYITVKRDANNCPYSFEVHLKENATLAGILIKDGVIASSDRDGKVPF